jgi:site-specific DNA-methyltransferase (adenine-specific)
MRLMLGDCLDLLETIEAGSVDAIIADLPYGTTACKWDAVIPFEPMWREFRRVTKPNAAIVLTASQPFTTALIWSNIEEFKYCWTWRKTRPTGQAHAKNKPLKAHEDIAVFSRGTTVHKTQSTRRMTYNPQGLRQTHQVIKRDTPGRAAGSNVCFGNRPGLKPSYVQTETNYPQTVIEFPSVSQGVHPTQKPVALMEYLIRTYTNEGEVVLDPTMGSGTTGVACVNTRRNFIGIERDPDYFAIAERRIAEAQNATPLLIAAE